jgi:hypothetical protein
MDVPMTQGRIAQKRNSPIGDAKGCRFMCGLQAALRASSAET